MVEGWVINFALSGLHADSVSLIFQATGALAQMCVPLRASKVYLALEAVLKLKV